MKLLTSAEAAVQLGVKKTTVQRWVREGMDLPHVKVGRLVKFPERDLNLWLWEKVQNKRRKNFDE